MLRKIVIIGLFLCSRLSLIAEERPNNGVMPTDLNENLPYGQKPIDYFGPETNNAIEKLQRQLDREQVKFSAEADVGFLRSLLKSLDISPASQMLVFSQTALNPKLVSPKNPRAVYFNEECYVGWVPGAASLEIAAVDPQKGWMFYTLNQPDTSSETANADVPRFQRESQCLACHAGQAALKVPGGLVRAFVTDDAGSPLSGYSRVTHETPFAQRFGGWYVTGSHGRQTHRGNRIESKAGPGGQLFQDPNNVKDLARVLDSSKYLSAHSDLAAQMVLHHQVHGQNLIVRVNHEARLGKRSGAEDLLVRYLLFAEETSLSEPIQGSTDFAEWFEKRGGKDSNGRSLRELDLETRLFKYRMSYLIDTPLFDGLAAEVKQRIYAKLWEILSAENPSPPFDSLPQRERQAILEIVSQFKNDLPPQWAKLRDPS